MTDNSNYFDPLKILGGFEVSKQWIIYDVHFEKFFAFFKQNIKEINVFTEHEVLENDEIKDLLMFDEDQQRQKLEQYMPDLLKSNANEVALYTSKITGIMQAEEDYIQLLEVARIGKAEANARLNKLEDVINVLTTEEKEMFNQCHCQAKSLETLQEGNKKLYKEARNCFTRVLTPPLLFYQLPLELYLTKCDSFLQHFTLYIQENYKIHEYLKYDNDEVETEELTLKLKALESVFAEFLMKNVEEKAKVKTTQSMINELDLNQIHTVNLNDLERDLYEFQLHTEHHLMIVHKTLRNDLKALVHQLAHQRIELVLYENTKHKLERALRRLENDKGLTKLTSDALSNAELVWIAIQFDLERTSNRIDNVKQLTNDSKACWRRIKAMHNVNANISNNNFVNGFLEALSELLMKTTNGQRVRSEVKACLHEYEKFCRLLTYAFQNMVSGRSIIPCKERFKEFKRLEAMLEPLIYDSPIEAPVLLNVNVLCPIHNAKMNQIRVEKTLRELRSQFQANIVEKMEKEPLWRASQMLWIWFLKQPKRLLMAMEEVKRAASNVPALSGIKNLSGIKRK